MTEDRREDRRDFDPAEVLDRPEMAFLASAAPEGPRSSPLWFLWEDGRMWLIGERDDSFVRRLAAEPRCALTVVRFDAAAGVLRHVGLRGRAEIGPMDPARLDRLLARYLGPDRAAWNPWFCANVAAPLDVMIAVTPQSLVAKDVSFFRTGPALAPDIAPVGMTGGGA